MKRLSLLLCAAIAARASAEGMSRPVLPRCKIPAETSSLAYGAASIVPSTDHLAALSIKEVDWTAVTDIAISSIGLALSIALLGVLEPFVGSKLFVPPMLASAIIFFNGPKPPNPKGFLMGTLCSATLSAAVLAILKPHVSSVALAGASSGALLLWYRVTNTVFPPAAVLAGLMAGSASSYAASLSYLIFPWLSGHIILYACAMLVSRLRGMAKKKLA